MDKPVLPSGVPAGRVRELPAVALYAAPPLPLYSVSETVLPVGKMTSTASPASVPPLL
jgi:hypothetical protein